MALRRCLVRFHNLSVESGAQVTAIEHDRPAWRATLLERDVIVGLDWQSVASFADLLRLLSEEGIGVKS